MTAAAFDVAVVGLGAVGSAALHELARRGARVVGIDRHAPPHDRGSSHGESRITRQAIGEGEAYVPLVLRSNVLWEELEAGSGERLLERCGFVYITRDDAGTSHHGKFGFLGRTLRAARAFDIPHELLDAAALRARFPQFTGLAGDETAYFEPGGGYLRPEACIAAQLAAARRGGAEIVTGCQVHAIERDGARLRLRTAQGSFVVGQAIVAAGIHLPALAARPWADAVSVQQQTLHWFDVVDRSAYAQDASPTFIWTHGSCDDAQFYGFPPIDGAVKVARETYGAPLDAEQGPRPIEAHEGAVMAEQHVSGRLAGLAPRPSREQSCCYAVLPDNDFLIHRDPALPGATFVSACSGHGFKHAAAIGEALAQAAAGESPRVDLRPFALRDFSAPKAAP